MANPALPEGPALRAEVLDRAGFDALADAWPGLQKRTGHEAPFYAHGFLRAWMDAFAEPDAVRVVVVRDGQGLRAALPLHTRRESFYGMPVTKLVGTANVHSARFDLLAAAEDTAAVAALWEALRGETWDLVELPDIPPSAHGQGVARELVAAAGTQGFPTGEWESMQTPYIPLGEPLEAVMGRLSAKFRSNLRRRRKKLTEHGEIAFERFGGGPELDAKLEEGLALEAAGWKGREGTAIASDAATRGFYLALARWAAEQGALSLFFLRSGGRAVAFHYALTHGGTCYLPKLGFDESLSQASPGQLILEDVLADCCGRKLREFDFLGPNMPWKQDWTDKVRVHTWCYVFRDGVRGRALRAAKFQLAPKVKEVWPWKR